MMASSTLLPRLKIQAPPDKVNLDDLHPNGKLLSDIEIDAIINQINEGRTKARDLHTYYDISFVNGNYFAIYKGATGGKALGSGKHGIVKLAQNLVTGEWVALKVVKDGSVNGMIREVDILQIVQKIVGWYQRENKLGNLQFEIFMPLEPGINMKALLTENRELSAIEYVEIIISLLELCDQLLNMRVVHRDIKDANIMVELASFIVSLVDFGLAARMNKLDGYQSQPGVGSSDFQAPEIKDDDRKRRHEKVKYNEKTEIYALAKTIARLLHLPYDPKWRVFSVSFSSQQTIDSTFETKIPQESTQRKIISQLNSMVQTGNAYRPTMKSAITHFTTVRNELDDASRIISVGCVNLYDYADAIRSQQKIICHWLRQMDRVCLIDQAGMYKNNYVKFKRHFEEAGLIVLDEVVQYQDLNEDMPRAIAEYLKCLPRADTRHYTGYFVLDRMHDENSELQRALNVSGIMHVISEEELFDPFIVRHCGRVINSSFADECTKMLEQEHKRLTDKYKEKPTEKRKTKMTALQQATSDIHDIMTSGWVRVGVFGNVFRRLDEALDAHEMSKTAQVLTRIDDLLETKLDDELMENRQKRGR